MTHVGEYAGEPEIAAASIMLGRPIVIYYRPRAQEDGGYNYVYDRNHPPTVYGQGLTTPPITLLHTPDRQNQPGHYDLMVRASITPVLHHNSPHLLHKANTPRLMTKRTVHILHYPQG